MNRNSIFRSCRNVPKFWDFRCKFNDDIKWTRSSQTAFRKYARAQYCPQKVIFQLIQTVNVLAMPVAAALSIQSNHISVEFEADTWIVRATSNVHETTFEISDCDSKVCLFIFGAINRNPAIATINIEMDTVKGAGTFFHWLRCRT